MKIAYLGPAGTYSGELAEELAGELKATVVPYPELEAVVMAVSRGEVELGLVPVENSLEGSVNVTLDMLGQVEELQITGERIYPIRHSLLAPAGVSMGEIEEVFSHPQSLGQCRRYLRQRLPGVRQTPCSSNASAFLQALKKPRAAAIGSSRGGQSYGLVLLEENIQDEEENYTRFLLLGKEKQGPTGRDKTSLLFSLKDEPGSLYRLLGHFARQKINLTKIKSRPSRKRLGEYIFFLDLEGHSSDQRVAQALRGARAEALSCKVLGSYPRAF